jgi:hypothetical protein
MGLVVKPYTHLAGFGALVLEESYVLGIQATPSAVTFDVDFVLTPEHPAHAPPPPNETECFRVGRIRFVGVHRLVWDHQGAPPATDASGEVDFGHIDSFDWEENTFRLEGDWGRIELIATQIRVEIGT